MLVRAFKVLVVHYASAAAVFLGRSSVGSGRSLLMRCWLGWLAWQQRTYLWQITYARVYTLCYALFSSGLAYNNDNNAKWRRRPTPTPTPLHPTPRPPPPPSSTTGRFHVVMI